ncbi:MAG TPA: sigma-70 family RNA polymerase sigma factor [Gemmatimonadales bacterium]|nr:sigma-70 family RNA polymerase sigma factor [Gemmatimonadales bacterium]
MMVESWTAPLETGDPERAWDLFVARYRGLIFGAIRHYTGEPDDVMDVFARVCEAFREKQFARLRRCAAHAEPTRPLSTWLVAVVHNLTIDWFRHRDGRRRLSAIMTALPPIRQRIFQCVFVDGHSHVETYELLRSRDASDLPFGEFLTELSATYRAVRAGRHGHLAAELAVPPPAIPDAPPDPAIAAEQRVMLGRALEALPTEDRLAVQLYVVDEMPADQVARVLGYPNAKTVYNRVYRALGEIRSHLAQSGIRGGDL